LLPGRNTARMPEKASPGLLPETAAPVLGEWLEERQKL
jgi:hypothetical protein